MIVVVMIAMIMLVMLIIKYSKSKPSSTSRVTLAGAELDGRHSYVPEWVTPALDDEIDDE